MRRGRVRFSVFGLLGLTTLAAVGLGAAQHELGLAAIAGVFASLIVWLTTTFALGLLRDGWIATRRRSWRPFALYATKGGAYALVTVLAVCLGGSYWAFGAPANEGLEELGGRWSGVCRWGALVLGGGLALLHVCRRDFWAVSDAVMTVKSPDE